jgi:mono/diheme cytochrome c family protein
MNPATDGLGASPRDWKPMTYPFHGRTPVVLFAFVLTTVLSSTAAVAADPSYGEQLARRWCAACHIVAADSRPVLRRPTHGWRSGLI